MMITTEAKAREEIRNIIKTAISQYEQDSAADKERKSNELDKKKSIFPTHYFVTPYTGPSVEMRVLESIISSPILTDHMEAFRWGREELFLHRLVTRAVEYGMKQADEERARKTILEEMDRIAAENTKAKKRFWQFLS